MVVKNNYHWLDSDSAAGFLANGDFAEVLKISNQEERYGLSFADLYLRLIDYPDQEPFTARAVLDTLYSDTPSLPDMTSALLYENIWKERGQSDPPERKGLLRDDPYLNAIQVKFTYSVTCHKAQGGQWPVVFVKHGYYKDGPWDTEYLRWLYTAVSRATKMCYLVDFERNNS